MIVALLSQKGGVGKTTLALHCAGQWVREGRGVTLIDADPQGSDLDRFEQWAQEGLPRLFRGIGLARETFRRAAPQFARDAESSVKAPDIPAGAPATAEAFTARLTIDVTPGLRGRIKVAAFRRGVTFADMSRELLAREFPEDSGDAS